MSIQRFMQAVDEGNVLGAILIARSMDMSKSENELTPLMYAVQNNNATLVSALLEMGASTHSTELLGKTALHYTTPSLDMDMAIVDMLLSAGACIKVQDYNGWSPLYCASMVSASFVEKLLKVGANTEAYTNRQDTPLMAATTSGKADIVAALLRAGANVFALNANQSTALHIASAKGYTEIAQMLLDAGSDVDAKDDDGKTALHRACFGGHEEMAKLLLKHGASVHVQDVDGKFPIHHVLDNVDNHRMAELLLEAGSNVDVMDNRNNTPLLFACMLSLPATVQVLLKAGANPDLANDLGDTPRSWSENNRVLESLIPK